MRIALLVLVLLVIGGFFYFSRNLSSPLGAPLTGTTPAANASSTITLTPNGFVPQTLTIPPGSRVSWVNQSGASATINSDDHPTHLRWPFLNLGRFDSGSTLSVVFPTTPGTYTYHDHLHPQFKGTVIVK